MLFRSKRLLELSEQDRLQAMDVIYRNSPEVAHLVEQQLKGQGIDSTVVSSNNINNQTVPMPKQQPQLKPPRQ